MEFYLDHRCLVECELIHATLHQTLDSAPVQAKLGQHQLFRQVQRQPFDGFKKSAWALVELGQGIVHGGNQRLVLGQLALQAALHLGLHLYAGVLQALRIALRTGLGQNLCRGQGQHLVLDLGDFCWLVGLVRSTGVHAAACCGRGQQIEGRNIKIDQAKLRYATVAPRRR